MYIYTQVEPVKLGMGDFPKIDKYNGFWSEF